MPVGIEPVGNQLSLQKALILVSVEQCSVSLGTAPELSNRQSFPHRQPIANERNKGS